MMIKEEVWQLYIKKRFIKRAFFEIHGNKALGPDGFGAFFYQDTWDITGKLVVEAVNSCLASGKLLKEGR